MVEIDNYKSDIDRIFSLNLPWDKLSGTNILITGATGLIGSCVVDVLMRNPKKDYNVFAAGRNVERAKLRFAEYWDNHTFEFIRYDVNEPLCDTRNFDYIIHAASNASPNFFAKHPVEIIKSNIYGVVNLMEYGMSHRLRRLLYVSSGEIYGDSEKNILCEDDSGYVNSMSTRACYPSSKRAAETLCVSYADEYNIETVVVRPCHTYGPYFTESDNRVFAQFIRNVLNGEDIKMKSNGVQFRSWCYVVDSVSAILHVLFKGENSKAYNIADNNSCFSIRELAETVAGIAGRKVIIDCPDESEKKGYSVIKRAVFNTSRLESLGWSVHGDWKNKLRKTIEEEKHIRYLGLSI